MGTLRRDRLHPVEEGQIEEGYMLTEDVPSGLPYWLYLRVAPLCRVRKDVWEGRGRNGEEADVLDDEEEAEERKKLRLPPAGCLVQINETHLVSSSSALSDKEKGEAPHPWCWGKTVGVSTNRRTAWIDESCLDPVDWSDKVLAMGDESYISVSHRLLPE